MPLQLSEASAADEAEIEAMLSASKHALMHYGPAYRRFLRKVLPECGAQCLLAKEAGRIAGILPSMARTSARFGTVVNSLPFFGSHGGPWLAESGADNHGVARALIREFDASLAAQGAVAATIVANPLDPQDEALRAEFPARFLDRRIGQVVRLPGPTGSKASDGEALFAKFHQKTRNAVRKAGKSGFSVSHTDSREALDALADMHRANIAGLGGVAKPPAVFHALAQCFRYDDEYRVYVAERDGRIAAALLVLYQYRTAEYFVPASLEEFRNLQPMSLLITEAMTEAVRRGCRLWNWGGTWESQTGVHMFKARWGSEDLPYHYYISLRDPALLKCSREELLREYPYFYVAPFGALEAAA
jgi:CelD/BcsL family acetyltransferase involved in cellulose biosynthesis